MCQVNSRQIGFDVGAISLKAIVLENGEYPTPAGIAAGNGSFIKRHKGKLVETFVEAIRALNISTNDKIGLTGSAAEGIAAKLGLPVLDLTKCRITVIRKVLPRARNIIDVGGASATLIQLDDYGNFQGHAGNSLCAAGTGAFLDEQAARLGISYDEFSNDDGDVAAMAEPPSIATRCSVFAKSDLIHRQQEGFSRPAMWSGLCKGMTKTLLGTLLRGQPLAKPTAIIGGVALNREVLKWMRQSNPELILVPENPAFVAAAGAALLSVSQPKRSEQKATSLAELFIDSTELQKEPISYYPWALSLERSIFPSFKVQEQYDDVHGNEVRLVNWPNSFESKKSIISGYLGIDIGSTSTKLALIDGQDKLILDVYRKTAGDPITATKKLFQALRELSERKGVELEILGAGTTGSGRKIVGEVIGADSIINEISAHVAGAIHTDPGVDTIFEIGGQDSKYMHVKNGHIRESNMNYVCAAGTGSFVEEQANKLGIRVSDVGGMVLGTRPPRASDRCTVFMEQDIDKLIQRGATSNDALAAIMVSVVKNYLNKVVGNRYRSRGKIFFQGATARNPALVAAFERLLDVEIVVSPYCHVMGAFGVALITRQSKRPLERQAKRQAMAENVQKHKETTFRGLDLDKREIAFRKETCDLCQNNCRITFADIEGVENAPSWGYLCGRDPTENRVRVNPHTRYLRKRRSLWRQGGMNNIKLPESAPIIGIPQTLQFYTYFPMWRRFFNELGFKVQLSGVTNDSIREAGTRLSAADFCFPAKMSIGHIAELANKEGVDFIFVPQVKNTPGNVYTTGTATCPYVQGMHMFSKTALEMNGIETVRMLTPFLDMCMSEEQIVKTLSDGLSDRIGASARRIRVAWRAARQAQQEFEQSCYAEGRAALAEAEAKNNQDLKVRVSDERLLVLVGRPYNNFDDGVNLGLPNKIAEHGWTVLPMDLLEPELGLLGPRYRNVYWSYGQKILAAMERISRNDRLNAIYFTNFSCGPDSFLLSYAEEIMGNKPFLALELDEHGADAGYMTRIEAFFDVLKKPRPAAVPRAPYNSPVPDLQNGKVWIPPMHLIGSGMFAAAFKRHGINAEALPPDDQESLELGRSLTRGSECLPAALTIGSFIRMLRKVGCNDPKNIFFMPTAEGPCRFGQYVVLHRQILDRLGYTKVPILSATSSDAYEGVDEEMSRSIFKAIIAADILLKVCCKVRPYELVPGETNRKVAVVTEAVAREIAAGGDFVEAVRVGVASLASVPHDRSLPRPLVGVVGEIYVRSNSFANEDVITSIERFGGEAWMTPVAEWLLFTSSPENFDIEHPAKKLTRDKLNMYIKFRWLLHWEGKLLNAAGPILADRHEPDVRKVLREGARFMPVNIGGEAQLTIGRTIEFAKQGVAMVVNCSPFGCMPGIVSTALFNKLRAEIDLPIINMFYDGNGNQNKRLEVFLNNTITDVGVPLPGMVSNLN